MYYDNDMIPIEKTGWGVYGSVYLSNFPVNLKLFQNQRFRGKKRKKMSIYRKPGKLGYLYSMEEISLQWKSVCYNTDITAFTYKASKQANLAIYSLGK